MGNREKRFGGFGGDWRRRLWLFDKLIWTLMSYGVEI